MSQHEGNGSPPPLEQRVERLESAVAAMQDTHAVESRVVDRVSQQLHADVQSEAERLAAARSESAAPLATAIMAAVSKSTLPQGLPVSTAGSHLARASWLALDLYREAVAIFRMFIDVNYHVAWSTRVLTVILLLAILLSEWWMPLTKVFLVGGVLEKLIDLVLAFVMYKALSREAQRYMESRRVQ